MNWSTYIGWYDSKREIPTYQNRRRNTNMRNKNTGWIAFAVLTMILLSACGGLGSLEGKAGAETVPSTSQDIDEVEPMQVSLADETDETEEVDMGNGSIVDLPLVDSREGEILSGSDALDDANTPSVYADAKADGAALSWTELVERVEEHQMEWYMDEINRLEAEGFVEFDWDNVVQYAEAEDEYELEPRLSLAIQVYGAAVYLEEDEIQDLADEVVNDRELVESLEIVKWTSDDLLINTRGLTRDQLSEFVDPRSMVRVSLTPFLFDEEGVPYRRLTNQGVFVDCLNVWAMKRPVPKTAPTTTTSTKPGVTTTTKPGSTTSTTPGSTTTVTTTSMPTTSMPTTSMPGTTTTVTTTSMPSTTTTTPGATTTTTRKPYQEDPNNDSPARQNPVTEVDPPTRTVVQLPGGNIVPLPEPPVQPVWVPPAVSEAPPAISAPPPITGGYVVPDSDGGSNQPPPGGAVNGDNGTAEEGNNIPTSPPETIPEVPTGTDITDSNNDGVAEVIVDDGNWDW